MKFSTFLFLGLLVISSAHIYAFEEMSRPYYTVYFAGALFNHKDLVGNLAIAQALETESDGTIKCCLPQEASKHVAFSSSRDIRDHCIQSLLECDMAIFNFDGADLDSGTVAEFMIAKMLDIPCVVLRTDFRSAGDQEEKADQWNLMCSGYPRSITVSGNIMALYNTHGIHDMYTILGQTLVFALGKAFEQTTIFDSEKELLKAYRHVIKACNLPTIKTEDLSLIVRSKIEKGVY